MAVCALGGTWSLDTTQASTYLAFVQLKTYFQPYLLLHESFSLLSSPNSNLAALCWLGPNTPQSSASSCRFWKSTTQSLLTAPVSAEWPLNSTSSLMIASSRVHHIQQVFSKQDQLDPE